MILRATRSIKSPFRDSLPLAAPAGVALANSLSTFHAKTNIRIMAPESESESGDEIPVMMITVPDNQSDSTAKDTFASRITSLKDYRSQPRLKESSGPIATHKSLCMTLEAASRDEIMRLITNQTNRYKEQPSILDEDDLRPFEADEGSENLRETPWSEPQKTGLRKQSARDIPHTP